MKDPIVLVEKEDIHRGRLEQLLPDQMDFLTHIPDEIEENPDATRLLMRGGALAG